MMTDIRVCAPTEEDAPRIGRLVYEVDPFIYPALFGSKEVAAVSMPLLMSLSNSPFAPIHIRTAKIADETAAIVVFYDEPFPQKPDLSGFYGSGLPLPESCKDVCERYLAPMCDSVKPGEVYLSCIATDKRYRGKGAATALIKSVIDSALTKTLSLDVLQSNVGAIDLYKKLGFEVVDELFGYSHENPSPLVFRMERRHDLTLSSRGMKNARTDTGIVGHNVMN